MNLTHNKKILYGAGIIALWVLLLFVWFLFLQQFDKKIEAEPVVIERIFPEVKLVAEAGIVKDLKTGEILYEKNKNEQHPLASLAKIMSTIVAHEFLGDTTEIAINQKNLLMDGDVGLLENERWRTKELLGLILLASSNDASNAIKSTVESSFNVDFIEEMNKKGEFLGLSDTYFLNETGLDVTKNIGGSYGSAEDIADLLEYAIKNHYDLFKSTEKKQETIYSLNYGAHTIQNTNTIINSIPSFVAGKTGFTDLAGGNLAIVFEKEPGHPIAVVVLGSTKDGRFTDVEQLVWATFKY